MSKQLQAITIATVATWFLVFATGIFQFFYYRPTAAAAYADMETLRSQVTLGLVVRHVHRWLGWLAFLVPAAGLAVSSDRRQWRIALPWIVLASLAIAGLFTGYVVPWDQLALWSVTVGTNMLGFEPVFGDNIRFVLLGGIEVSAASLWVWVLVHVIVLPLTSLLLIAVGAAVARSAQSSESVQT